MKVLALVPPGRSEADPSRFSFLSEELSAFADRGVEMHAISYHVQKKKLVQQVALHPVARRRQVGETLLALRWAANLPSGLSRVGDRVDACRLYHAVATVIVRERIDLVYSPFAWPLQSAAIPVAAASGVPVVISLRGADVLVEPSIGYGRTLDPLARERMSSALSCADYVIGVSKFLMDRGIELGADPNRASVVLKGADEQRFSPVESDTIKRRLGLGDGPVILFAGHLIRRKGIDVLLRSLAIVRRSLPNVTAVICGDGVESESLRELVRQEQVESAVHFVGRVGRHEIPDYFRACDVFVLPSLTEGSGNVLVEAGACGKPSVGTATAGIPDYIVDGVTGYLFRKADPNDLADKLTKVLSDPALAQHMGIAARQRVLQYHTYDQMIDQLLSIFKKVIANRNKAHHECAPAKAST